MPWQPAHEAHAIERVSITFQFAEAIPSKLWQATLNRATLEYQEKGFNAIMEGVELNLGQLFTGQGFAMPGGTPFGVGEPLPLTGQGAALPGLTARTFRVVVGSQVREEISLSQQRFVYTSTRYDRWGAFSQRLYDLIGPPLEQALSVVNLPTIKIEYWDRFVFDGLPAEANYRELFRMESRYLPTFFFDMNDLWHSHVGHFASTAPTAKRLINLNVDVFDFADAAMAGTLKRSIGIYSMGQDTVVTPPYFSAAADTAVVLDDLHVILKEALADVILPEMAERISLNGNART
jgi:hypothetical protein